MSKIARLAVENFMGIAELDVQAEDLNVMTGGTGTGKTSVLEAIEVALANKGRRPRLVRDGAEGALLLVELDDGTVIERRVGDSKALSVQIGGVPQRSPQTLLNDLFGGYSFNPVDFLAATPKEQSQTLLSLVPLEANRAKLAALAAKCA